MNFSRLAIARQRRSKALGGNGTAAHGAWHVDGHDRVIHGVLLCVVGLRLHLEQGKRCQESWSGYLDDKRDLRPYARVDLHYRGADGDADVCSWTGSGWLRG